MTVYLIVDSLRTSIFPSRTRVSKCCWGSPAGPRNTSQGHAQGLDTFGVLNRHAAVGNAGIAPVRHMNRSRRIGSAEL